MRTRERFTRGLTGVICGLLLAVTQTATASTVDRAVVRFTAPELGGIDAPRFVFERELSFEARLEAHTDASFTPTEDLPYRDSHLKAALERHIAESLLESLPCLPAPTSKELDVRALEARLAAEQRVGGPARIASAAKAEGLEIREIFRVFQRQARASLYLDRMVAPFLEPTSSELQLLHQSGRTPFSRQAYETIQEPLRRWYVASRLQSAVAAYYSSARNRLRIHFIPKARS